MILKNKNIFIFFILLFIVGCALPRFSMKPGGAGNDKEIPGKTIQVDFFENKSPLASSTVSTAFTEGLRDIMLSQTPLELVANGGDLLFEGFISGYRISPLAIQAGSETAAQNRLTMSINVSHSYAKIDSLGFNNMLFSAFVDYNATDNFSAIEEELIKELNYQLTQNVYDKAFGGDW
jgi:hypothetical protein